MPLQRDSLVLYKGQPAVVREPGDKKLTIELPDGGRASVRPKDVALLHPGPARLPVPAPPDGDPLTAWQLLDGQPTTVAELAELAYGDYTPATAWAAWTLVDDGVYFSGAPDAVTTHTGEKVADIQAARAAKAAEEAAWSAFVARAAAGQLIAEDERYLGEVVALALGQTESSRVLRQLERPQTREAAHAFLLAAGYWTPAVNPYPARLGVPVTQPEDGAGPLPEEPRRDLTHLLALAIDDEGSSDPDDALSLEDGRLWVHVADVAALVPPGSPADLEARERAANLYLPEGTVRMLPDEITDRLALGLQDVSPALSFGLTLAADGAVEAVEIVPSWVKVTRTTYEAAEECLDEWPYDALLRLAETRRARREANGSVEIELPEAKVKVDDAGDVMIRPLPPLRSRELVREAMLAVGEAVGRYGLDHDLPLAYTNQPPPEEMTTAAGGMAGDFARRRTMQRSQQRPTPGRHAGLGLDVYVQSTSPLRRYLDLVAHQQLRAHLRGETPLDEAGISQRIGAADEATGAVRITERLSIQHWTMVYLLQNPDWQGEGIVVEQRPGRDLVVIPDLAWETELYRRQPRPLNSAVRLGVESVDLPNRTAHFKAQD